MHPCISNEAFERVASNGVLPNMIVYLMTYYNMSITKGTNIIFFWSAATNFMPILGAFLSDSYFGRFRMIGFGSIASLLGMIILWLTAMVPQVKPPPCNQSNYSCKSPTLPQLALLYSSFSIMSIGAGGIRSCSIAFGADQLDNRDNVKNKRILESFFNWYYTTAALSVLISVTGIVYIQEHMGWKVGFGVPSLLMLLSVLFFFLASPFYVKLKVNKNLVTGFAQVLVVAHKNRHFNLPSHHTSGSFLNKACIIGNPEEDLTPDGSASEPWSLCTVEQVEELKALIKVIPLWSTGIMISVCISQSSFPLLQAYTMDRHITSNFQTPAGSFGMFTIIAFMIWIVLYDGIILPLVEKFTGKPSRLGVKQRMGIGLLLSCISMAVSAIVESVRRRTAIQQGFLDDPLAVVDMSAMWLVLQNCLNGLAEAFNAVAQLEFFYSEFPKSMSSIALSLFALGAAVANLIASLLLSTIDDVTKKGGKESWVSINEAFEKVASFGLQPNMILYLMGDYQMDVRTGTNVLYIWTAATNFTPLLGAFLSDAYFGRFGSIGWGSIFSLLGMILLWLTTMIPQARPPPCNQSTNSCESPSPSQLVLLFSSFGLMSIGAGGIRSSSIAFGADQLDRRDNPENKRVLETFFSWYYVSASLSAVIAITVIVYIQEQMGWAVGFGVPVILMFLSALFFFLASPFYVKLKAKKSLFTGFAQVLVAAYKNRRLTFPPQNSDGWYHHTKGAKLVVPSEKIRFLNKACIIRNPEQDVNPDGSASDPWDLCTVEQVEELKALIKVIPLWSSGIMMFLCMGLTSFPVLQANSMDRHITLNFQIPAGSFGVFTIGTLTIWIAVYDRIILPLVKKVRGKPSCLGVKERMGIGLLLSCMAMALSAIVESVRRRTAIRQGFLDDAKAVVDMSAMWLVPQHCLNGVAEAFNAVGQTEFYYTQLPKSMSSIAAALLGVDQEDTSDFDPTEKSGEDEDLTRTLMPVERVRLRQGGRALNVVIALGSLSSFLGMTLLWLTAMIPEMKPPLCDQSTNICELATPAQLAILFSSFGLMSIGAGCIRPCSIAFGADQLDKKDKPDNEIVLQSFFNWYYASIGISTVLALTIIVYIQDQLGWEVGFGIPAILMVFSALMFLLGSSLYIKVKANKSLFTEFSQVLVVAFKNRSLAFPTNDSDGCYHYSQDSNIVSPTNNLRFLNKACILRNPERDLNPDMSASNPWSLCTVDQVESLKSLLRVIPMWSTGIMILVSMTQTSFSTLQANTMDRHITSMFQIPAGSFAVFTIVTLTIWVAIYDRTIIPLLAKYTGRLNGLSTKLRMGIGLLLSCLAMGIAAIVENIRRRIAIEQGLADNPSTVMNMSAMWLVPQYCLFGLAEAFNAIGQIEFYYSQFPKNMSSIAVALFILGMAVSSLVGSFLVNIVDGVTRTGGRESWLSSNLNKGHLDYYYLLITIWCLINFVYFLGCCWAYGPLENERIKVSNEVKELCNDYKELPSA
ncbi:hypothetical protein HHK36_021636 [Tetracentron sinense]|uniref:Uncharacterized protein n=1 Tax=Tetracentron sinense TaxID=13715 RepID=A0A835D792_TETSI|nr:hypothetical protein HHK36_021636 [Tetracentron sinense]